jgi:hypothetical protein
MFLECIPPCDYMFEMTHSENDPSGPQKPDLGVRKMTENDQKGTSSYHPACHRAKRTKLPIIHFGQLSKKYFWGVKIAQPLIGVT